jgi:hypothetical protein
MILKEFIEELLKVTTAKVVTSLLVGSIATYAIVDHPEKSEDTSEFAESDQPHNLKNTNKTRRPSSIGKSSGRQDSEVYKATAKITSLDQSNYIDPENSNPKEQSNNYNGSTIAGNSSSYQSLFSNTPTSYPLARQEAGNDNLVSDKSNKKTVEEQIFRGSGTTSTNYKKLEV